MAPAVNADHMLLVIIKTLETREITTWLENGACEVH
jgi:hypothetical protein